MASSGFMSLALWKGNSTHNESIVEIAKETPNTGGYWWNVNASIVQGSNYIIRLDDENVTIPTSWSSQFTIDGLNVSSNIAGTENISATSIITTTYQSSTTVLSPMDLSTITLIPTEAEPPVNRPPDDKHLAKIIAPAIGIPVIKIVVVAAIYLMRTRYRRATRRVPKTSSNNSLLKKNPRPNQSNNRTQTTLAAVPESSSPNTMPAETSPKAAVSEFSVSYPFKGDHALFGALSRNQELFYNILSELEEVGFALGLDILPFDAKLAYLSFEKYFTGKNFKYHS